MRRTQTSIRPALGLTEKIQIILNSCISWKDKIECMRILIFGEMEEKNKILNQAKVRQQVWSEALYLAEEIEKNPELAEKRGYVYRRVEKDMQKNKH